MKRPTRPSWMMSSSKFRPPAQTAAAEMLPHTRPCEASRRSHAAHSIVGQNKCIFPNYNTDSQPQETRRALLDSLRSLWLQYTEGKPRAASDTRILKHACSVSTGRSERLWNLICTESHEHEERCTAAENTDWCINKRFIIALRFHKLER